MATQHIPAWKRLGLRLKFANDSTVSHQLAPESSNHVKKRKQNSDLGVTNGSEEHQPQLKKSRASLGSSRSKLRNNPSDRDARLFDHNTPKRKKSVSFTPDTKIEDGDSAQTIQVWVPDSPGSTPMKQRDSNDTVQHADPVKAPKRQKRPKKERDSASTPPRKATIALEYLRQFYEDHSSWKFNKNHETWILKHALSAEHIPREENLPLALYLQGLKSEASKKRLAEQSREALSREANAIEEDDEAQSNLVRALEGGINGVADVQAAVTQGWLGNMHRGRLILLSLHENLDAPLKPPPTNGPPVPRVKKNKSRTSRIEVESSSSSESDSEDDESDASNSKTQTQRLPDKRKGLSIDDVEDTSSSGSSAESSSGTSDDSEGDSDTSSD